MSDTIKLDDEVIVSDSLNANPTIALTDSVTVLDTPTYIYKILHLVARIFAFRLGARE